MIEISKSQVFNFEGAFRGLRNPMNSWDKSDSFFHIINLEYFNEYIRDIREDWLNAKGINKEDVVLEKLDEFDNWLYENSIIRDSDTGDYGEVAVIGPKDMELAQRMIGGGMEESKFMRQIFISVDINAPRFWWTEMDTYKIGTVANSCSTMHKLTSEEITSNNFSFTNFKEFENPDTQFFIKEMQEYIIGDCECLRKIYNKTKDKNLWRALIEILPNAYMQKRTWTANYQVLRNIYFQRCNHKLQEWRDFCKWIESLPYAKELICYEKE